MSEREVGGPTGKYPLGKLNAEDAGGLNVGIAHTNIGGIGMVVLNFYACVGWLAAPRGQALELAAQITAHAEMLPDPPYVDRVSHMVAPIAVALDGPRANVLMVLESPAHMVGMGKPGALRLAKQISDAAQQLPAEEMPA